MCAVCLISSNEKWTGSKQTFKTLKLLGPVISCVNSRSDDGVFMTHLEGERCLFLFSSFPTDISVSNLSCLLQIQLMFMLMMLLSWQQMATFANRATSV